MKKSLSWFLFAAILMLPLLCEAQISVKFKKLEINNITNKKSKPVTHRMCETLISDVRLKITAEIINDGDTTVYPEEERMRLLYYDFQYGWRKTYSLPRQMSACMIAGIGPHFRKQVTYYYSYNYERFYDVSSLYYVSSTVPTMRLFLSIPGQEPIMSDAPETIFVNGVKLDPDWHEGNNGSLYQLVNNEMVQEYMRENPYLFGSEFSQDILISEFQSNMLFAQRQYSLLRLPELKQPR